MRYVVIDTETTGLSPENGDRIVEIAAVVIKQRQINEKQTFHQFVDPQRSIPAEIARIHGIDEAKLIDEKAKPFTEIGHAFFEFIEGATLVFHNAPFDFGFIKKELADAGLPSIDDFPVIDSLVLARKLFPQQRNNLDALCDRLQIDRSKPELHDVFLTARVYLAMIEHNSKAQENPLQEQLSKVLTDQSMASLVLDVYGELECRFDIAMNAPLSTGFASLDHAITSLSRGELIIIAGKHRTAKSALAANIISNIAFRHNPQCSITIFSLAMSALEWVERTLASEAKVDTTAMRSGKLSAGDWKRLAVASATMAESNIHLCDSPASIENICHKSRRLQSNTDGSDLIVIDNLQLIESSEMIEGDNQNFSAITQQLKTLARELNVPIILLLHLPKLPTSQPNRPPKMDDLHRFGRIDLDADMVLLMDRLNDSVEIAIAKLSSSTPQTVTLNFSESWQKFSSGNR